LACGAVNFFNSQSYPTAGVVVVFVELLCAKFMMLRAYLVNLTDVNTMFLHSMVEVAPESETL